MNSRQTYIGLDIIRFAAALAVAFYHLSFWWWLPSVTPSAAQFHQAFTPISPITRWGYVGVPVFFVLSGFIIAESALGRSVGQFLRSRILRLYPAVWICAPLLLAVTHETSDLPATFLRTVTLWPGGPWLSGVFWTLAVEIIFYGYVSVALAAGVPLWRAGAAFGLIGSAFWILRAADFALGGHAQPIFSAIEASTIGKLMVVQSCFFGVGISLWAMSRSGPSIATSALLACFMGAGCISTYAGGRFEIAQTALPGHAFVPTAIWLGATMLIALSLKFQPEIWRRGGKWSPVTRTIGLATYPLYLIHSELGATIVWRSALPPYLALAAAIASVCLVAFTVVQLERWPRAVLGKMLQAKRRDTPAADLP